jgi:uncharacterized protein
MEPVFEEVISERHRLRELSREPSHRARAKIIDHIDDVCHRFIAVSPFVLVASRGGDGRMDISPKGDAPGFVAVVDEKTLAIPDRPGNHRLDTFENLLEHPEVGLLFLIPGHGDTLRVSGKGRIVRDRALQGQLAVNGRVPGLVLVITVEEAFMHCSKASIRSRIWNPNDWPDRSSVPSLAEAIIAHAKPTEPLEDVQAAIEAAALQLY